MTTAIGTRVTLTQIVDVYPTGVFDAGLTGTLSRIDGEGSYWVKLDQHFPELDEWNNELQIWDWSDDNNGQFHPETYLDGDTEESLCDEFEAYAKAHNLPLMSADELIAELQAIGDGEESKYLDSNITDTKAHIRWLCAFFHRWMAMAERYRDSRKSMQD